MNVGRYLRGEDRHVGTARVTKPKVTHMNEPTHAELMALWNVCKKFVDDQTISCAETIYQTDWVIENAYEFIEDVCKVVGYKPYEDDE